MPVLTAGRCFTNPGLLLLPRRRGWGAGQSRKGLGGESFSRDSDTGEGVHLAEVCAPREGRGSELWGLAVPTLPVAHLCPLGQLAHSLHFMALTSMIEAIICSAVTCSWLTDCHKLGLQRHVFPLSGSVGNQCIAWLRALAQGLTRSQSR